MCVWIRSGKEPSQCTAEVKRRPDHGGEEGKELQDQGGGRTIYIGLEITKSETGVMSESVCQELNSSKIKEINPRVKI